MSIISELAEEGRFFNFKFAVLSANRWSHFCGESKSVLVECAEDEDTAVVVVAEPKVGDIAADCSPKTMSLFPDL